MATINGMYVLAESEDPNYEVDVTDQPVEDGVDTIDHVQRKPRQMSITGVIVGNDAAQIRLPAPVAALLTPYVGRWV